MSTFLEGIESNTTANAVPPESFTEVAFPPSAENAPSTSVFPESTSSLMKEEDLFGERLYGSSQCSRLLCLAFICGLNEHAVTGNFFSVARVEDTK